MKVFVLIISDHNMRPRCDIMTTAVFAKHEEAFKAMEADIASMVESEQVEESEIERYVDQNFAVSADGRFAWKIEERNFIPC